MQATTDKQAVFPGRRKGEESSSPLSPEASPGKHAPLKIVPLDRRTWRCESGTNTYRMTSLGDGRYHCTCPARVECRHVKQLKELHQKGIFRGNNSSEKMPLQVETTAPNPIPIERRQGDRRANVPKTFAAKTKPTLTQEERIERLRTDLSKLLYGFKDDYEAFGRDAEAERLRLELSTILRLGFGPDRTMVFVNDRYNCTWYRMEGDNHVPIKANFLYGRIANLDIKPRKDEGRPSHHLYVTVEADRRYLLQTGYNNHFAKGFLAAVARMTPVQLREPVWIQPQKTGKTTLCNIKQHDVLIKSYYNNQSDWRAIAIQATKNVWAAQALGRKL
jgi:hypothetical protein